MDISNHSQNLVAITRLAVNLAETLPPPDNKDLTYYVKSEKMLTRALNTLRETIDKRLAADKARPPKKRIMQPAGAAPQHQPRTPPLPAASQPNLKDKFC